MAIRWITEADTSDPTNPKSAQAAEAASWLLYKLTAEKYPGITTRVEWYGYDKAECLACHANLIAGSSAYNSYALPHSHVLYRTTSQEKIRLRGTPVVSVSSISSGGQSISASEFWVVNSTYLVKRDGGCWDLNAGVEIEYTAGINPPQAGKDAAILLANELILAAEGSGACALPTRVTSVSRQGMDYSLLDPQDFLDNGRTGIYEIDSFIKAANPIGAKKKPRIFSVDTPSGVTRR